jgi:excisionase family DNA binding protein
MPTTHFSEEEMDLLAEKIAVRLLPMLIECLKDKARWTVKELQGEHFTAKEVAERYKCSPKTIYRLAKENRIETVPVGKAGVRFSRNAVEKAVKEGWLHDDH